MVSVRRCRANADRGTVLVLTLILTVVLALTMLAITRYVTTALRTSDVASERTETNLDSSSAMAWAVEQFAKKRLLPDVDCGEAPTYKPVPVPNSLFTNGSTTTLECAQTEPINGEPVVHLIATSAGVQTRVVESTVEVPRFSHGARVADWRVDIPIVVPAYVTTTTAASASTTTTTTSTAPNQAPTAGDIDVTLQIGAGPFTVTLPATDPDGPLPSYVSNSASDARLTVTPPSPGSLDLTLEATSGLDGETYTFMYVIEDSGGLQSTGNVFVTFSAGPPSTSTTTTTTTTLPPPNPSCTFTVTTNTNGGNTGNGTLAVSNSGGPFTGWQVRISQLSTSKPWQFTWDSAITATVGSQYVDVSGSQTVTQGETFNVSAALAQPSGNPKISAGQVLTCAVLSPSVP